MEFRHLLHALASKLGGWLGAFSENFEAQILKRACACRIFGADLRTAEKVLDS